MKPKLIFIAFLMVFAMIFIVFAWVSERGYFKSVITSVASTENCEYKWSCTEWYPLECDKEGNQKRTCVNIGSCSDSFDRPEGERKCAEISKEMFDIEMRLEYTVIHTGEPLTVYVMIENRNEQPIEVNLAYSIYDITGEKIYTKTDFSNVGLKTYFIKLIKEPDLKPGGYVLELRARYGESYEKKSEQEFRVENRNMKYFYYFVSAFFLLAIVYGFFLLLRPRKPYSFN